MMRLLITLCSALAISGCEDAPKADAEALARLMVGTYETAPGDSENNFIDRRIALPPLGEGQWLYLQLNSGPERKLYRQRVLQLIDQPNGAVRQIAWTFKVPEENTEILSKPDKLMSLDKDDIAFSFEETGCHFYWHKAEDGWQGDVNPETCLIFSERRQKQIGIGAEGRLTATQLMQAERGFDETGKQIWGSAPNTFAVLNRIPD